MPTGERTVLVVTSADWPADPRLNRHVEYLRRGGWTAEVVAHTPRSRLGRVVTTLRVVAEVVRRRPAAVVLPNPELHVIGSVAARLRGIRAVIDIQEDYPKVAAAREWIPRALRPVVAVLSWVWEWLARKLASAVVVAAPELSRQGDHLVLNIPDPQPRESPGHFDPGLVVYVGDVTRARGALEMVAVLGALGPSYSLLVVGRVDSSTRAEMEGLASSLGVSDRLRMPGRLDHAEAWAQVSPAVAGLCLLRPAPAYREAVATKIYEYMDSAIPPVVSDLPGQAAVVGRVHPDLVCADPEEAAMVIKRLGTDPTFREEVVKRCLDLVRERWDVMRPDLALQRAVEP